jgi:hypothetical protein
VRPPYSLLRPFMTFVPIPELLEELQAGRPIVLVDDPSRENEGDLCFAAEFASPELVNLMIREARGLVCLALDGAICDQLQLPMQVQENKSRFGTAFTVSIEAAAEGVSTGHLRQATGLDRSSRRPIRPPSPRIWPDPATSSRCAPGKAACWCAPARPRASSTSAGWPACAPPA